MTQENNCHSFDRSGLASLDDLQSESWNDIFRVLEKDQRELLSLKEAIWSPEYRAKWPIDALHWWSRIWEYPYVYFHLKKWKTHIPTSECPVVIDLGSGANFFSFSVARLGWCVKAVDVDQRCCADLQKAIKVIPVGKGRVEALLYDGMRLPFGDNEVDAVYCVSVLEHIPDFETIIVEAFRVLKPGGIFLLTIDLDLRGNLEIGPERHKDLVSALTDRFAYLYPDTTVHPRRILHSNAGPYPFKNLEGMQHFWFSIRQRIFKPLLGRKPLPAPEHIHLAVQGFALIKEP